MDNKKRLLIVCALQYILNVKNIDRHYIKDSLLILKYCIIFMSKQLIIDII